MRRMPADAVASLLALAASGAQAVALLAVAALALAMLWRLVATRGWGNRIQLEIDLQVHDAGSHFVGELMVILQNMGQRVQDVPNLFIEVRQSRYVNRNAMTLVPPVNMISPDLHAIALAPGVRQTVTWTFEIPREVRMVRAVAFIDVGRRHDAEALPMLTQEFFGEFGSTGRFATRLFEVTPGLLVTPARPGD